MKYIEKLLTAEALKILSVAPEKDGNFILELEDGSTFTAVPDMVAKYIPITGDYLVKTIGDNQDVYVLMSAKYFTSKYAVL